MKRTYLSILIAGSLTLGTLGAAAAAASSQASAQEPAAASAKQVLVGTYPWGIDLGVDGRGKRHLVAGRKNGDLWYATDRTGSWTSKRILRGSKNDWVWGKPSIAIDDKGRVHIAVVKDYAYDVPGGTKGIWYLTDRGRARGNFSPKVRIGGDDTTDPALRVVGNVRYLAFATLSIPGDETWPLFFKTDRSGSWKRERVAIRGWDPDLRVDRNGRARIVFSTAKGVRYSQARSKTGDFTRPVAVSGGKHPSGAPSLVLSRGGRPHVAWPSSIGGNRIWYTQRTSSGWRAPIKIGLGRVTEISRDARSRPHVVIGSRIVVHKWRTSSGWQRSVIATRHASGYPIDDVGIRGYGRRVSIAWAPAWNGGGVWVARD